MASALQHLADTFVLVANDAVVAATIVLAPFALFAHLRRRRDTMVDFVRMDRAPSDKRPRWLRYAVAVMVLAAIVTGIDAVSQLQRGFLSAPCLTGCFVMAIGALAPVGVFLAQVRRLGVRGVLVSIGAALAGAAGGIAATLALGQLQLLTGLDFVWNTSGEPWPIARQCLSGFFMSLLVAGLWGLVVAYPEAIDEARRRTSEADRALREAELVRLRGCIEPHFLLNSLHAVASLVDEEPKVARRMLASLGDLYRDALSRAEEVQSLGAEVAWLRRYAEILEARHAGALAFRWEIDREAEAIKIPTLLLQPLLENAVKHGALATEGGGEVVVRARVENGSNGSGALLTCEVMDDGPGPSERPREGAQGLAIVKRRLAVRYGDRASFHLAAEDGRTHAVVRLPALEAK